MVFLRLVPASKREDEEPLLLEFQGQFERLSGNTSDQDGYPGELAIDPIVPLYEERSFCRRDQPF